MRRPPKPKIAGSNPAGCAINSNRPCVGFDLCCAMSQVLDHPAFVAPPAPCGPSPPVGANVLRFIPKFCNIRLPVAGLEIILPHGGKCRVATKGIILGRWWQPPKKPWSWYLYPKRYIKEHAEYLLHSSHHLPILICLQNLR